MSTHKDAMKRHRQNQKRNAFNKHYKSQMRTMTKKMRAAAANSDSETLNTLLPQATKLIQKLGQKGIIHKNQANRRVSRLHKLVNRAS